MEHKGYTIDVSATLDAFGKCCDASYKIHRASQPEPVYAGVLAGVFASLDEAETAALTMARKWIDELLGA